MLGYKCILFMILYIVVYSKERCSVTYNKTDVICDCSNRGYRNVPKHIPITTTILNLSQNKITLLQNETFKRLWDLHSLFLYSSQIDFIHVEAFSSLNRLRRLDLSSNFLKITSFDKRVFCPVSNLTFLDISDNMFHLSKEYPDKHLSVLTRLQYLGISGMRNVKFGDGFRFLLQLQSLTLRPCDIRKLTNNTFVVFSNLHIQEINLECQIMSVEPETLFPFKSVKTLSIKNNNVIRISDLVTVLGVFKDKNMTLIDFSKNYRTHTGSDVLTPRHFAIIGQICVKAIILYYNQISLIRAGSISVMKYKSCLETLNMSRNVLYGDDGTALEIHKLNMLKVIDISYIDPIGAPMNNRHLVANRSTEQNSFVHLFGKASSNVKNHIRLADEATLRTSVTYTVALPPSLQYVYAEHLLLVSTGLLNINFTFGNHFKLIDMNWIPFKNCKGRLNGLNYIQTFRMSGFDCKKLDLDMINSFKKLRSLDSRNANLALGLANDVKGKFLDGLTSLEDINFSGNQFSYLHQTIFKSQLYSLKNLSLSHNKFVDFPLTISQFLKLNSIDLSSNIIRYLKPEMLNDIDVANSKLNFTMRMQLNENIFECNCKSLPFIKWTQETHVRLDNSGNYSCLYIDGSQKTTVYAYQNILSLQITCQSKFWLVLSICMSVLMIIILIISSITYKYRITLHYWYLNIRRKYRNYSKLEGDSREYKYSAFVAYHNSDYKFVCGPLRSYLEIEKGLKVCLHHRDFPPGNFISDNIFEGISVSRKIILIISPDFLKSSWCEFELNMASMQMFNENRDSLIVILLNKIPTSDMPNTLLQIWNKVTCLEIDDDISIQNSKNQLFWKRLYEAVVM